MIDRQARSAVRARGRESVLRRGTSNVGALIAFAVVLMCIAGWIVYQNYFTTPTQTVDPGQQYYLWCEACGEVTTFVGDAATSVPYQNGGYVCPKCGEASCVWGVEPTEEAREAKERELEERKNSGVIIGG